jgi:hypothetical protein
MSTKITYLRQTDTGSGEIRQKVLGAAPNKHVSAAVDELVRNRLDGSAPNPTSGNVVEIIKVESGSPHKVGEKFPSARAACRALGVPLHSLTVAFHRAQSNTVQLNGVTFKKRTRR